MCYALSSSQFWPCMRMCWSVQLLVALVRAMLTATVTHTAGIHTSQCSICVDMCLCLTVCVSAECTRFPLCIGKLIYSCMQDGKCVSRHQCDADLHGQQQALLLIFTVFLLLRPFSLSGCPIAAAEKLSKSHDKQHLAQPGSEHLKGSPNDRVLRWVIKKVSHHIL